MLARTDPDAPKHRGISYFLLDMKSPGITVRPLINMANGHGFNEVFFDNVRVPGAQPRRRGEPRLVRRHDDARLRALEHRPRHQRAARTSRSSASTSGRARPPGEPVSPAYRLEVADRAVETGICELLSFVVISIQAKGGVPNMEASMCKMYGSELSQRIAWTKMHLSGMRGQYRREEGLEADAGLHASQEYMATVPATIAAGTSEIQRNIIATRGLGLPRG